jgi:hypothetical protein
VSASAAVRFKAEVVELVRQLGNAAASVARSGADGDALGARVHQADLDDPVVMD